MNIEKTFENGSRIEKYKVITITNKIRIVLVYDISNENNLFFCKI
jgi:hypothetical protein